MTLQRALAAGFRLLRATVIEWLDDNAAHHAAALAFYTLFSLAPLLVIAVAIAGFFIGQQAMQAQIIGWVQQYLKSQEVTALVHNILENVSTARGSRLATALGIFGLFFGATAVFTELRRTLNLIWDVPEQTTRGVRKIVVNRLLALLMVISSGFILLSSLLLDIVLSVAADWLSFLPLDSFVFSQVSRFLFLYLLSALIFALILKYVPERSVTWSDVGVGALVTALLFSIGRYLINLYLGYSTVATAYGAAGSLAIVLVWIYYSTQIFFLGAEFTQVYARTYGASWMEGDLLRTKPDRAATYRGRLGQRPTTHNPRSPLHQDDN